MSSSPEDVAGTESSPADSGDSEPLPPNIRAKAARLSRGDLERAEELEQRVRVRVWEASANRPEQIRSIGAFRHGVLVNVHREVTREERRHHALEEGSVAEAGLPRTASATPEDPADSAERVELFRLVRRAVKRLTDTSRMVVKMRYFENLQQRQIAQEMGVGEVKVSRILARARERLKNMLP